MYYECGICDHLHPWEWDGDCRDDANRFTNEDVPFDAVIHSMSERVDADALASTQGAAL